MNCPKCNNRDSTSIDDVEDREDGGVDEVCSCGACGYRWVVINPVEQPYKNAVRRLKEFQPKAHSILFDKCHCRSKALMLSYQLGNEREEREGDREGCGYWCSKCGFGASGARDKQPTKNEG